MTINEMIASDKVVLTPKDVAPVLGMHPQYINLLAKKGELPFRCIRSGNRTKIPRLPLLEWLGVRVEQ